MRTTTNVISLLFAVTAMAAEDQTGIQYTFKTIAREGQSEDNVKFGSYFQPGGISNLDEISFAPSVQTGGESVFLSNARNLTKVRAAPEPLPGGAKFGYTLGPVAMTAQGDTAFISVDLAVPLPLGVGAGVYRTIFGALIPVMLPGVTRTAEGKRFHGAAFNAHMNDRYETVFPGLVCSTAPSSVTSPGDFPNPCETGKLAFGIYRSSTLGQISTVVQPGSPAPGGSTFDYAQVPFINNGGDVAFDGHVYGEPCNNPYGDRIFCGESVYLWNSRSRSITSIAHQGSPSPVPGKRYHHAFGPVLNDLGDVVFIADLSSAGNGENAVFLYSHGTTITVAKPGDHMPGGGLLSSAGAYPHNAYLDNNLEVAFVGTLTNKEQGLYLWKNGKLRLVAKTGTPVDGTLTIANLDDFGTGAAASTQIAMNDFGRIIFSARLNTGASALLLASPR